MDEIRSMEKLALKSPLGLEEICRRLLIAFQLPEFEFGGENQNEWGVVQVDELEIMVSKPANPGSLSSGDGSVPYGFNVGISLILHQPPAPSPDRGRREWVPAWAQKAANALKTTLIHHRTSGRGHQDLLPMTRYNPE